MENKQAKTVKIGGGADYAKVAERIRIFRQDCPRGLIETTPTIMETGQLMFKARILKDKSDPNSAEAVAHSLATKTTGDKLFEKHESVAVGRALAILGYLASGEIASSEEMEEYEEFVAEKRKVENAVYMERLTKCKSVDELGKVWSALPIETKVALTSIKDELKAKLSEKKPDKKLDEKVENKAQKQTVSDQVPMSQEEMAEIMVEDAKNNPTA